MRQTSAVLVALTVAISTSTAARAAGPADPQDSGRTEAAAARERQRQAIAAMPSAAASYDALGVIRRVSGHTGLALAAPPAEPVLADPGAAALDLLAPVLLATGRERLQLARTSDVDDRLRLLEYDETIRGIPVLGGVRAVVEKATDRVVWLGADFLPDRGLPPAAVVPAARARHLLQEALLATANAVPGSLSFGAPPALAYTKSQEDGHPVLVWRVDASYASADGAAHDQTVWVDALTGRVEGTVNRRHEFWLGAWNAGGHQTFPNSYPGGAPQMSESDVQVAGTRQLVEQVEAVFSIYGTRLFPVAAMMHWGSNPLQVGSRMEAVGLWILLPDGGALTASQNPDAIAHEWGHGWFHEALNGHTGTTPEMASISEAYGDLAAVVADADRYGVNPPTWEIAEGLIAPGRSVRSWRDPRSTLPATSDWYPTRAIGHTEPHTNATIMGLAFYLLSEGGHHPWAGFGPIPTVEVPGVGYASARQIFMGALSFLPPNPTGFRDLADATISYARMLDGGTDLPFGQQNSTRKAWEAVGLGHGCTAPPFVPDLQIQDFLCRGHFRIWWDPVAGATTYFAEKVPAGWPWDLALPSVDGPVTQCSTTVPSTYRIHLQSCNGCGCSSFGPAITLQYQPVCE